MSDPSSRVATARPSHGVVEVQRNCRDTPRRIGLPHAREKTRIVVDVHQQHRPRVMVMVLVVIAGSTGAVCNTLTVGVSGRDIQEFCYEHDAVVFRSPRWPRRASQVRPPVASGSSSTARSSVPPNPRPFRRVHPVLWETDASTCVVPMRWERGRGWRSAMRLGTVVVVRRRWWCRPEEMCRSMW